MFFRVFQPHCITIVTRYNHFFVPCVFPLLLAFTFLTIYHLQHQKSVDRMTWIFCIPLLVDFSLNKIIFEWRHFVIQIFVSLVYGLMSIIWTLSTGRYIYPILDWKNGTGTAILSTLASYMVFAGVFSLIMVIAKRCK